jgi:molybdopterin molybdotransferase
MSLLSVSDAQQRLFALAGAAETEIAPLSDAIGRWLSSDVAALRSQPWTDLSAMDGYAIRHADLPGPWTVIGESAAGGDAPGAIQPGQAMRIFTGAAMPDGADCVLIQEEAERSGDRLILTGEGPDRPGKHVRKQGSDFTAGGPLLASGARIGAAQAALAAIGGHGALPVRRSITVAMFSTGNELVEPGRQTHSGQLPASNGVMLVAMLKGLPVIVEDLGIMPDDLQAQTVAFRRAANADIIVTTGGASVGDHDLVKPAFEAAGGSLDFWRIALRPGKPLMAGRNGEALFLGLPGNPVSAFVTATLFLLPLIRQMSGASDPLPPQVRATLTEPMPSNAARAQYVRGLLSDGTVRPLGDQDSAAMRALAGANALIVRPPHAPAAHPGEMVECIALD